MTLRAPILLAAAALAATCLVRIAAPAGQEPAERTLAAAAATSTPPGRGPSHVKASSKRGARSNPADPLWNAAWGLRATGAPGIWRSGQGSPLVVVAVVDSGVDSQQPDLRGGVRPGWNAMTGTADTEDDFGHGTAVAGVIAARAHNGVGASGYCPRCSIMPVKVLDASGHGTGALVAAGIDWAVAHGAAVINLSLVLGGQDSAVSAAVARALARGVVVVAAAGNTGDSAPTYPASEPGVVSVAGIDSGGKLYSWSSRGGWVDVAAPGCNETGNTGGGFGEFCGTSSAAAAVSGLVALALSDGVAPAAVLAELPARTGDDVLHALPAQALVEAVLPLARRTQT